MMPSTRGTSLPRSAESKPLCWSAAIGSWARPIDRMPRSVSWRLLAKRPSQLSDDLRSQHTEVPWRRIADLRDVLIHQYMGVDLDAVWEIAVGNIPTLKQQVEQI